MNAVSAFTTVTLTPLITAPELSVIVPTNVPVPAVCPSKVDTAKTRHKHRREENLTSIKSTLPLSTESNSIVFQNKLTQCFYHTVMTGSIQELSDFVVRNAFG